MGGGTCGSGLAIECGDNGLGKVATAGFLPSGGIDKAVIAIAKTELIASFCGSLVIRNCSCWVILWLCPPMLIGCWCQQFGRDRGGTCPRGNIDLCRRAGINFGRKSGFLLIWVARALAMASLSSVLVR